MTPQERYEAREAEREKLKDLDPVVREHAEHIMLLDTVDRFVTSLERLVDVAENVVGGPYGNGVRVYTHEK